MTCRRSPGAGSRCPRRSTSPRAGGHDAAVSTSPRRSGCRANLAPSRRADRSRSWGPRPTRARTGRAAPTPASGGSAVRGRRAARCGRAAPRSSAAAPRRTARTARPSRRACARSASRPPGRRHRAPTVVGSSFGHHQRGSPDRVRARARRAWARKDGAVRTLARVMCRLPHSAASANCVSRSK